MTLSMLAENFKSYDWIIFAAFAANLVLFFLVRRTADELFGMLHASPEETEAAQEDRDARLAKMHGLRARSARLYAVYANVSAIFPLLGILGTVVALLSMTGELAQMENGFLAALTSTFWGLIAAIIFKFLDSFLSYKSESNELYLTSFEETGKRYTVTESYAADRPEAPDDETEHHY